MRLHYTYFSITEHKCQDNNWIRSRFSETCFVSFGFFLLNHRIKMCIIMAKIVLQSFKTLRHIMLYNLTFPKQKNGITKVTFRLELISYWIFACWEWRNCKIWSYSTSCLYARYSKVVAKFTVYLYKLFLKQWNSPLVYSPGLWLMRSINSAFGINTPLQNNAHHWLTPLIVCTIIIPTKSINYVIL